MPRMGMARIAPLCACLALTPLPLKAAGLDKSTGHVTAVPLVEIGVAFR